jgi:hypothetical protein
MIPNFDHKRNNNSSVIGAKKILLAAGFEAGQSLVDIGCGTGVFLDAAQRLGASSVQGYDGVQTQPWVVVVDLTQPLRPAAFQQPASLVVCLEVAEHLPESAATVLISSLACFGNRICFSAATPGQPGDGHINCQPQEYWIALFERQGYVCDTSIRQQLQSRYVRPWYRNNTFIASRNK